MASRLHKPRHVAWTMGRAHVHRIIGIDLDQGVEHPPVAGALVERHQARPICEWAQLLKPSGL